MSSKTCAVIEYQWYQHSIHWSYSQIASLQAECWLNMVAGSCTIVHKLSIGVTDGVDQEKKRNGRRESKAAKADLTHRFMQILLHLSHEQFG